MPTESKVTKQYPNLKNQPGNTLGSKDRVAMNSNSADSRQGTRASGRENEQDFEVSSHKGSGSHSRISDSSHR